MKKPLQRIAPLDLDEEASMHDLTEAPPRQGANIHLYLVRHAKADGHVGDTTRTVSDEGRAQFRKAARTLAKHCKRLDLILTSSLVRAVQTAEILASQVEHGSVEVLEELSPEHSARQLLASLEERCKGHRRIALVGHKPSLVHVLNKLAGESAGEELHFHNGAIVRIDVSSLSNPTQARGRWWIAASSAKKHKGLPRK